MVVVVVSLVEQNAVSDQLMKYRIYPRNRRGKPVDSDREKRWFRGLKVDTDVTVLKTKCSLFEGGRYNQV